jgi:hypothetical protein
MPVTFTETGTSGDSTGTTLTIAYNGSDQASIAGNPGSIVPLVLPTYVEFLSGGVSGSLVSIAATVDYVVAPSVSETFNAGLVNVAQTNNFYVGGSLDLTGAVANVLSGSNVYVFGGTLTSSAGTVASAFSGSHVTVVDGGVVDGTGNNLINALSGATIGFGVNGGTIAADALHSGAVIDLLSSSTVTGFSTGADKIDFTNVSSTAVDSYTITSAGGHSTMSFYSGVSGTGTLLGEATVQTTAQLTDGTYSLGGTGPLTITTDASGTGFTVAAATSTLVCFAAGTRIRTTFGDMPVEGLAVGDLVVTASGDTRPIVWLGHKRVAHPKRSQLPVRVKAGAFGESLPQQDLLLSPGHAVCVDVMGEVFIPIDKLINGATIAPVETDDITYWHVELESHDVLLAEGLPAESYMDAGNRAFFGHQYGRLENVDPERVAESLKHYAHPFVDKGMVVEAVRQRLDARAEAMGRNIDRHLEVADARAA